MRGLDAASKKPDQDWDKICGRVKPTDRSSEMNFDAERFGCVCRRLEGQLPLALDRLNPRQPTTKETLTEVAERDADDSTTH